MFLVRVLCSVPKRNPNETTSVADVLDEHPNGHAVAVCNCRAPVGGTTVGQAQAIWNKPAKFWKPRASVCVWNCPRCRVLRGGFVWFQPGFLLPPPPPAFWFANGNPKQAAHRATFFLFVLPKYFYPPHCHQRALGRLRLMDSFKQLALKHLHSDNSMLLSVFNSILLFYFK